MTDAVVRTAVVRAGRMGRAQLDAVERCTDVTAVAVVDPLRRDGVARDQQRGATGEDAVAALTVALRINSSLTRDGASRG